MEHGIEGYFAERERNSRLVASLAAGLGGVMLAALLATQIPVVHRALSESPVARRILRFGFEGPPRYVQLVHVEAVPGFNEPLRAVGKVSITRERGGGGGRPVPAADGRIRSRGGPQNPSGTG